MGGYANPKIHDWYLRVSCLFYAQVVNERPLPAERYGRANAIHTRFLQWEKAGVFEALCKSCSAEYDEFEAISWRQEGIDGAMIKALMTQQSVGPNPTDRGKNRSERHLLVNGCSVALSLVVTRSSWHYVWQLQAVLDVIMVNRSSLPISRHKHLCADAGYTVSPADVN